METVYDLIIVGGGPGGIASAVEATIFKVGSVLLIEKGQNHSQTIRQYYKDGKRVDRNWKGQEIELLGNMDFFDGTKESTLDYFEQLIDNEIIETAFGSEVSDIKKCDDLFTVTAGNDEYQSKNIIVSIGRMGRPNKPSYKIPPSIRILCNFNPYDCRGSEKLLVVGGGDSAVEYACQLTTQNIVTLAYRKPEFSRINDVNLEMVHRYDKEERLRLRMDTDIVTIENENDKVKVNYSDGSSVIYDRIIYGLGGTTPVDFMRKCGIELDQESKLPLFNEETFESTTKGMYIAGDIVFNNGGSIAAAINHAYHIMTDITK